MKSLPWRICDVLSLRHDDRIGFILQVGLKPPDAIAGSIIALPMNYTRRKRQLSGIYIRMFVLVAVVLTPALNAHGAFLSSFMVSHVRCNVSHIMPGGCCRRARSRGPISHAPDASRSSPSGT